MNIKHNINYFKMSDLLTYISIGLMAVGLPLFIFAYGFLYIMSIIMLPFGAVGFIIGVSIRSSEKDLDLTIKKGKKFALLRLVCTAWGFNRQYSRLYTVQIHLKKGVAPSNALFISLIHFSRIPMQLQLRCAYQNTCTYPIFRRK